MKNEKKMKITVNNENIEIWKMTMINKWEKWRNAVSKKIMKMKMK